MAEFHEPLDSVLLDALCREEHRPFVLRIEEDLKNLLETPYASVRPRTADLIGTGIWNTPM